MFRRSNLLAIIKDRLSRYQIDTTVSTMSTKRYQMITLEHSDRDILEYLTCYEIENNTEYQLDDGFDELEVRSTNGE